MCIFYLIRSFVIFYLFFGKKINTFSLKIYTFYILEIDGTKKPPLIKSGGFHHYTYSYMNIYNHMFMCA